jgi:tRNA U54 and U55 pseudouridine synthase Pus10
VAYALQLATMTSQTKARTTIMFKQCSFCGKQWNTREEFLADGTLRLEGYQWDSLKVVAGFPPDGMLVFTHSVDQCGTSLALAARVFKRETEFQ